MRFRLTLSLIILNSIVFGLIYWLGRPALTGPDVEYNLLRSFGDDTSQIESVTIGGRAMREERKFVQSSQGQWLLKSPIEWPANIFAVEQLLGEIQFLDKETSFPLSDLRRSGQDLADYGLDEPVFEITLEGRGRSETIRIGLPIGQNTRYYLKTADEKDIWVIGRELPTLLITDISHYRSSDIFSRDFSELKTVTVQITDPGDVRVRINRRNGGWDFETPIQTAADSFMVEAVLQRILDLEATKFFPEGTLSPSDTGLGSPGLRVTFEFAQDRKTLLIGNRFSSDQGDEAEDLRYARLQSNPTVFLIANESLAGLRHAQESLRETRFLSFDESQVNTIRISEGNTDLTLQQLENGDWQLLQQKNGELSRLGADREIINHIISTLRGVEALSFPSDAPSENDLERFGLTTNALQVLIEADNLQETLFLGRRVIEAPRIFARTNQNPFVYEVSDRLIDIVSIDPLHYRDRVLYRLPSGARITGMQIFDLNREETRFKFVKPEGGWDQSPEDLKEEKVVAWSTLVSSAQEFRVDHFLDDEFEGIHTAAAEPFTWRYRWDIELELTGGDEPTRITRQLFLTERLRGTYQVGASVEYGVTFALPLRVIEALHPFLFERKAPSEYIAPVDKEDLPDSQNEDSEEAPSETPPQG